MRRLNIFISAVSLLTVFVSFLFGDEKQYLITSHSPDLAAIVDANGNCIWSAGSEDGVVHPQDAAVTNEGIFTSIMSGALMLRRADKAVLWRYETPEDTQNPVAQPLDSGYYLVGQEGPCRLLEIDRTGTSRRTVTIPDPPFKGNHGQFRFCRKTPEGTYLFPMIAAGVLREYDADGKQIREFPVTGAPVGAARLPNGHTLAGMDAAVKEFDEKGNTVWEFDCVNDGGIKSGLITSVCRLKNGNTLVSYYQNDPETPDIIEISPEKQVINQLVLPDISLVAGMELLDEDGNPSPEILAR